MKKLKIGLFEYPISTIGILTGLEEPREVPAPAVSRPKTQRLRDNLEKRLYESFDNININNDYLYIGQERKALNRNDFKLMGRNFKKMSKNYDFMMVFGEDHSAAYPLYYCRGSVLRIDCHGDRFTNSNSLHRRGLLNYASYMDFVYFDRLKWPNSVDNIGLIYGRHYGKTKNVKEIYRKYSVIDVDVDGFSRRYHFQNKYSPSYLKVNETIRKLSYLKPKIIGIFEYRENEDKYNNVPKLAHIMAKIAIANIRNKA